MEAHEQRLVASSPAAMGAFMVIAASIRRRRWTPPSHSGKKRNPDELLVPDPAFPMLFAVSRVHANAFDLLISPWMASSVLLASALTAASSSARATLPENAVPNRFLILDLLALPPNA